MIVDSLNDKFIELRKNRNPNSLFASFKIFKVIGHGGLYRREERPPYPFINSDPTCLEVFHNLNKSDVLVGMTIVGLGFCGSLWVSRSFKYLTLKFLTTKYIMWWYTLWGGFLAMSCSYNRLIGFMENGLRWKQKDLLHLKYDFTREFEEKTIFKYLRERVD